MSFLDLYQGDQQQAMRPQANEGHDLPATFGESYRAAWDYGRLFEQSTSGETARMGAFDDYLKELQGTHGVDLAPKLDWVEPSSGAPLGSTSMLAQLNGAVGKINKERPSDQALPTLDEDGLQQRAVDKSRAAGKALADISGREHSGLGLLAGGLASVATDPLNLLAIPLAPETGGMSLLGQALTFGGVAAVSQAAIEAVGGGFREQVQPGYLQSGAPVLNVAEAFAGGAVLGGVTRALGNAWTKVKTGSWPTSVRDAGNVIESEANVANTNVYQGAGGEAAHRDALTASIDQILKEQPVDVAKTVTPEIEASAATLPQREAAVTAAETAAQERAAAPPEELPFQATAAEAHARASADALADGVKEIASRAGYTMPQEQAARVADALTRMSPEDAQDALRSLQVSPRQADAIVERPSGPKPAERPAVPDAQAIKSTLDSADHEKALQADIDRERVGDVSRQIPVDVDKDGNVVYRSLDSMADEAEAYRKVSEQIAGCAAPAAPEGPA